MMPVATSDSAMLSLRRLISDRRANLSPSIWGALSMDVAVGVVDVSEK